MADYSNYHGKAFVCFYVEIGERTRMSMSAKEGESYIASEKDDVRERIYRIIE